MAVHLAESSDAASSHSPSGIDDFATRSHDHILLAARIALGIIFALSGYAKLAGLAAFSASLAARGVPEPWLWGPVGAVVEFVGGMSIMIGLRVRYAALMMIVFVVVATAISHRFWGLLDPQQFRAQQTQFMKNLAIIGGFMALFAVGGGRFTIETLWPRNGR
jgi:putative oxidoreductase